MTQETHDAILAVGSLTAGGPGSGRHKGFGSLEKYRAKGPPKPVTEEGKKLLNDYLKMVASMSAKEKLLQENGQHFEHSGKEVPQGAAKLCFMNAFHLSQEDPNYRYAEGLAVPHSIGLPLEHAWVVDKDNKVLDPTWKDGAAAYYGVKFKPDYVSKVAARSGVYGILSYTNPQIFKGEDKDWKASALEAGEEWAESKHPRDEKGRFGVVGRMDPREQTLTPEQHEVEERFAKQIKQDPQAAINEYREKFGNVVNPDNAKELSIDYRADRASNAAAVHEPSSWLAKQVYSQILKEPVPEGKLNTVLFMMGGPGAGKSTAVENATALTSVVKQANAIVDGTFSKPEAAIPRVDQAIAAGRSAVIVYVHRDPTEAFENGVLTRASKPAGRATPIDYAAAASVGVRESLGKLLEHYKGNGRVAFVGIDNSKGVHRAEVVPVDELPKVTKTADGLKKEFGAILEKKYAEGNVSQKVYLAVRSSTNG